MCQNPVQTCLVANPINSLTMISLSKSIPFYSGIIGLNAYTDIILYIMCVYSICYYIYIYRIYIEIMYIIYIYIYVCIHIKMYNNLTVSKAEGHCLSKLLNGNQLTVTSNKLTLESTA